MVRISDILKKKLQQAPEAQSAKPLEKQEEKKESFSCRAADGMAQKEPGEKPVVNKPQELQAVNKPQEPPVVKSAQELELDNERAKELYNDAIELAKHIISNVQEAKDLDLTGIQNLISEIVINDAQLLNFFYKGTVDNYLYAHITNVMIVSLKMGLRLGYNKSKLNELGLAAFLHDLGMVKFDAITSQPRNLSKQEYERIKHHPLDSVEILSNIKNIPPEVIDAVKVHHECMNGGGYPYGIKNKEISEYARVITVADVYEALTHERPYRKRHSPHEAVKEMLANTNFVFDSRMLKILIDKVGIYPVSSWVELNTMEIGKVATINAEFPLRPILYIMFDNEGGRLQEPRLVDLSKQFNLFIKKPLSDEDVNKLQDQK